MENCIFCKIAKHEVPAHVVYEDKDFIAFLDAAPLTEGHILVIPKQHYRWVWDVPNIDKYYKVAGKVANALRKALNTEQVLSYVIGEEVPHAHVWLIPKKEEDSLSELMDISKRKKKDYTPEMFKEIAEKIKKYL
jgi:histidine triad (HIT) family protein